MLDGNFCFECAAMHMGVALAGDGKAYEMEKVNDHIVNGLRGAASTARRGVVVPEKREGGRWEDKKNRDARHWERKYREMVEEKEKWAAEREQLREELKKRTTQRREARNELSKVDRNWGALDRAREATRQVKMKLSDLQGDYDELVRKVMARECRNELLENKIGLSHSLEDRILTLKAKVRSQASRIEYLTTHDHQVVYKIAWEEECDINKGLRQTIEELGG